MIGPAPEVLKPDGQSIAPQVLGRPGRPRSWFYSQLGGKYFVANRDYKFYNDGTLVDIADSPVAERRVDESGPRAAEARRRLQHALDSLRHRSK